MTKYKRQIMQKLINGEPAWVMIIEIITIGVLVSIIFGIFK